MNESAIKTALYNWLSRAMGQRNIITINFDSDFVAENLIDGTINGVAWGQVAFDTDQATTLQNFADALWAHEDVLKALVTGAREITVYGDANGVELVFVGPVVTGGLSQPLSTITEAQAPVAIPVIFSDQNSPSPRPYPYATIRLDSYRKMGWDDISPPDTASHVATLARQAQMTISIDLFKDKPAEGQHSTLMEEIQKAHQSLWTEWAHRILDAAGIAINEIQPIQNVSAMLETIFEDHATFDFFIGISETMEDDQGLIEIVAVSGEADGVIVPENIIGD